MVWHGIESLNPWYSIPFSRDDSTVYIWPISFTTKSSFRWRWGDWDWGSNQSRWLNQPLHRCWWPTSCRLPGGRDDNGLRIKNGFYNRCWNVWAWLNWPCYSLTRVSMASSSRVRPADDHSVKWYWLNDETLCTILGISISACDNYKNKQVRIYRVRYTGENNMRVS